MTVEYAFVQIKGLSAKTVPGATDIAHAWAICLKHNHRFELSSKGYGSIDPARTHLNVVLRGARSWRGLLTSVRDLLGGTKVRANAKYGIELVFSLRAGAAIDHATYFNDCVTWAEGYFPCPLISACVHRDQPNPHLHLLFLPLLDGRLQGDKIMGYKARTHAMHLDFYEKVARGYGLAHPAAVRPLSAAEKQKRRDAARNALAASYGIPAPVLDALLTPDADVVGVLRAMGIETPGAKPSASSFVKIMTRKTKPEKKRPKHGGFESDGATAPDCASRKSKPLPVYVGLKNLH